MLIEIYLEKLLVQYERLHIITIKENSHTYTYIHISYMHEQKLFLIEKILINIVLAKIYPYKGKGWYVESKYVTILKLNT